MNLAHGNSFRVYAALRHRNLVERRLPATEIVVGRAIGRVRDRIHQDVIEEDTSAVPWETLDPRRVRRRCRHYCDRSDVPTATTPVTKNALISAKVTTRKTNLLS